MIIDPKAEVYAARHSVAEPLLLRELRETTSRKLEYDNMLSGPVVGAFLQMLVSLSGARNVLEVGTFTGYGTLWMAMGLPPEGRITTCEVNEKYERIARVFFDRFQKEYRLDAERAADPAHACPDIRILSGPALETLPQVAQSFDLIFLDADKEYYPDYYELLLPALRPGGLMVIDNAFWGGSVWNGMDLESNKQQSGEVAAKRADDRSMGAMDRKSEAIDRLNRIISEDPNVHNVLLTVRDGLHLVRKI